MNDSSLSQEERYTYVNQLAIKIFDKYKTDDDSISYQD